MYSYYSIFIIISKIEVCPVLFSKMWPTFYLVIITLLLDNVKGDAFDEEQYGVKYATDCEVCKIVAKEFVILLQESAGKHEVLETGYSVQVILKCLNTWYSSSHKPSSFVGINPIHLLSNESKISCVQFVIGLAWVSF